MARTFGYETVTLTIPPEHARFLRLAHAQQTGPEEARLGGKAFAEKAYLDAMEIQIGDMMAELRVQTAKEELARLHAEEEAATKAAEERAANRAKLQAMLDSLEDE